MKKLMLILVLMFFNCSMSNEDIVKKVNFCKASKLENYFIFNGITHRVIDIVCITKEEKQRRKM